MIINMNGGSSGGASGMNFKVVCSASRPTSPSENTIWVESSNAAGAWSMIDSVDLSSITSEGYIVISYEASNTSNRTFNALKKNELAIKLTKSYQRVSSKWVSTNAYIYTNGSWHQFSSVFKAYINVTYPAGSTCTVTNGTIQLTAPDASGSYTFTVPSVGNWTVSCTNGATSAASTVSITADGQSKSVTLAYNKIPAFTYDGDYKIFNDAGEEITVTQANDWNINFLTSGTLTIQEPNGASDGIDLFLVGGGGGGGTTPWDATQGDYFGAGGGGGGYTKTYSSLALEKGSYNVTVGSGGAAGAPGGSSSIAISNVEYAASGGKSGQGSNGGNGGSGGGAGSWSQIQGKDGGKDGSNGANYDNATYGVYTKGGTGQGSTTKRFGESNGFEYSQGGGGGGGRNVNASWSGAAQGANGNRGANTGDGGSGVSAEGTHAAKPGWSGIIVIRGHRTA